MAWPSASLSSGEPKKAIGYAEQARPSIRAGQQISTSMLFLGVGHLYLGHDDLAIEWLEKARAETPRDPTRCKTLQSPTPRKATWSKAKATAAELLRIAPNFRLSNGSLPIPIIARGVQKTLARGLHAGGQQGGPAGVSLVT